MENLAIIWVGVLIAHILAKATRLTPVLFYLFMGAVFVNTGLLPLESSDFIRGFAEIGIILIMFALGFEENTSNFLASIKRSWGIALFGGLTPFLAAFFTALYFWQNINIALMIGLAMTATAVSLTLVSLKSEGLGRTRVATAIMTSAVLDVIASVSLIAIIIPVVTGDGSITVIGIGSIILKALGFFIIVALLSSWVLPTEPKGPLHFIPGLGRFGLSHLFSLTPGRRTLVILIFAMATALGAQTLGLHPAVGAYMAGLILREEYFDPSPNMNDTTQFKEKEEDYNDIKHLIDNVAFVWIGPVFFVTLGTKIIFDWDLLLSVIPMVTVLTAALFIAQILSASLAAKYIGGFNLSESVMIGFGMLGRAELAFVVIDIAYVQNRILPETAFYTLMITAFCLNIAVPITIKLYKPFLKTEPVQNR